MSLYVPYAAAVALGVDTECRIDAPVSVDGGAPDAGAGAGADDASAYETPEGQDDAGDADDPQAARAVAGEDDDDDPDGADDDDLSDLANDPRVKRLLNQRRRLNRKLAKVRPIVEAVRGHGLTHETIGDVVHRARTFEELQRSRASRSEGSSRADSGEGWKPPAFDKSKLPKSWDQSDEGVQWLAAQAEEHHNNYWTMFEVLRGMAGELRQLRGTHQNTERQALNKSWSEAAGNAVKQLRPEQREIFNDLMGAAYREARAAGKRLDPTKVAQFYLGKLNPQPKGKGKVPPPAVRQRMAEHVRGLPGRAAHAGGAPAPARDRKNERISDVSRRVTGGRYFGT